MSSHKSASGTGTIRKITVTRNGKDYTYWQARFTSGYDPCTGKQIQHSITGKTQKEVSEKLNQVVTEINNKEYHEPSKITVAEWMKTWADTYTPNIKPSTAYLYGRYVDLYIVPSLGSIKLSALDAPTVQKFYNSLGAPRKDDKDPLSPKTIKCVHGVLHKALGKAVTLGYMKANPTADCDLSRVVQKEMVPLDNNQIAAFLAATEGNAHEWAYKIALFTGLREGELLGLTWDCVNLEEGTLTVRQQLRREQAKGGKYYFSTPKNGKVRTLKLPPTVVEYFCMQALAQADLLQKAKSLWNNEYNLVFTNEIGGFLSYRTLYDCYKRIVASIGVPNARFHDLRHTYAATSLQNGDDIKTLQGNLGHATAAFTLDRYGHITDNMKNASAERMEAYMQQFPSKKCP